MNSCSCLLFILRNTNDLEPGIVDTVHEVGAFDNKGADSQDRRGEKRNERGKGIKNLRLRQLCDKQEWFHQPAPYRSCTEKAWGIVEVKSSALLLNVEREAARYGEKIGGRRNCLAKRKYTS